MQTLQWLLLANLSKCNAAAEPDQPEAGAQEDKRRSKGAAVPAMSPCNSTAQCIVRQQQHALWSGACMLCWRGKSAASCRNVGWGHDRVLVGTLLGRPSRAGATDAVRDEMMASQGFTRLMLDTLTASLTALGDRRNAESAAEAAGATPGPGAAPGCGELLRPADRHVISSEAGGCIVRNISHQCQMRQSLCCVRTGSTLQ